MYEKLKESKLHKVINKRDNRTAYVIDTLSGLLEYFENALACGKKYENEKGNYKINTNPKTIKSLVDNLNKSMLNCNNSAIFYKARINDNDSN